MKRISLRTTEIVDRASCHEAFKELLGFPKWYGANMNAWIDCMSDLDDVEFGITEFKLGPGEILTLEVLNTESFMKRVLEVFADFIACTAFVNQRYIKWAGKPIINLAFL